MQDLYDKFRCTHKRIYAKSWFKIARDYFKYYTGTVMQKDNIKMIEEMTGEKVLALVKPNDTDIDIDLEVLRNLYE